MGFMAEEETPGSTLMVSGSELSKHVGKRVAVMGIIEAVDEEQVRLRASAKDVSFGQGCIKLVQIKSLKNVRI